jgi:ADP-glucose pyrophosphorylase
VVEDSVLWEGARIGARAQVQRSVVTDGCSVPARARLHEVMVVPAARGRSRAVEMER